MFSFFLTPHRRLFLTWERPILRLRNHPKILFPVVSGVTVLVVHVLTVTLSSLAGLHHLGSRGVSLGSALFLLRLCVVGFILFLIVSRSCHATRILKFTQLHNPLSARAQRITIAPACVFSCNPRFIPLSLLHAE